MSEAMSLKERMDRVEEARTEQIRLQCEYERKCEIQAKKEGRYRWHHYADGAMCKILYTKEEKAVLNEFFEEIWRLGQEHILLEKLYKEEQKEQKRAMRKMKYAQKRG